MRMSPILCANVTMAVITTNIFDTRIHVCHIHDHTRVGRMKIVKTSHLNIRITMSVPIEFQCERTQKNTTRKKLPLKDILHLDYIG